MTSDEKIIRAYLQAAHNRGGSYQMAMNMMADRINVLEDRLGRAGKAVEADPVIAKLMEDLA